VPSHDMRLVDALIAIAKLEHPNEWLRYCDLAQQLTPRADKQGPNFSAEDCARNRLTGSDPNAQGLIADFYSSFLGAAPSQLQQTWEASRLAQIRFLLCFWAAKPARNGLPGTL